jgi:hypothetical protein
MAGKGRVALPELSERQRRFAVAYFEACLETGTDYGISQTALRRAFPCDPHVPSDGKEAARLARDLLETPGVKSLIAQMRRDFSRRARVPEGRIVQELERLAVANLNDYIRSDGRGNMRVDLRGLGRAEMAAVQEITVTENRNSKGRTTIKARVKLFDKLGAADRLLRIFGSFDAANDLPVTAAEIQRVIDAMKRRMNLPVIDEVTVTDVNRAPSDDPGSV